jgi:hypothetical protein
LEVQSDLPLGLLMADQSVLQSGRPSEILSVTSLAAAMARTLAQ